MTKQEFAKHWFDRGVCPGCGAPLVKVAGIGTRHYLAGQTVIRGSNRTRQTQAGESTSNSVPRDDPRLCPWTADQLAALVHIGSGLVGSS